MQTQRLKLLLEDASTAPTGQGLLVIDETGDRKGGHKVEHLLDRSSGAEGEVVSNLTVASRLDRWRERMSSQLTDGSLSQLEQERLIEFLQCFPTCARTW